MTATARPAPTSPEEQEANAERLRAEARKNDAEASFFLAQAAESIIDGNAAGARLRRLELETDKFEHEDAARRATDEHAHVYRFDGEVGHASVKACITKLTEWHRLDPKCQIEVIFSSPGGSIFDGMELYDFIVELGELGHPTITGGAGMAASMAGILVQAGKTRYLTKECWLLIHRAAFGAIGQTFEVEDRLELIKRIETRIVGIFSTRSGGKLSAQKIRKNWERKDFWLTSDEALSYGLIDEVRGAPALEVPEE